jgi:hypothetical protein
MAAGECSDVSRKVAIGGGTVAAMLAMLASGITPGPLGMAATRPTAEAPQAIAKAASSEDMMQQTLILGLDFTVRSLEIWMKPPFRSY